MQPSINLKLEETLIAIDYARDEKSFAKIVEHVTIIG